MLGTEQIGSRVVVRRLVDVVDGRSRFTDVIGELRGISADLIQVRRDSGQIEAIPRDTVVAAKPIPPKRTSYRAIADLELACTKCWPAVETQWLGGWLLRASGGWTNRANTALPIGDPGSELTEAIDTVCRWYVERGLEPGFSVPDPLSKRVKSALFDAGWHATQTVSVLTCPIADLTGTEPVPAVITQAPTRQWLDALAATKGPLTPSALSVLGSGAGRGFASLSRDGRQSATGRVAVEDGVAMMSSIHVAPAARRQGQAGLIIHAMADWAAGLGASQVCVQVEQDNQAALALYAKLGFTRHHEYLNMRPPRP